MAYSKCCSQALMLAPMLRLGETVKQGDFFWKGETLLISRGYIHRGDTSTFFLGTEVIHQLEMFLASAATAHNLKRVLT